MRRAAYSRKAAPGRMAPLVINAGTEETVARTVRVCPAEEQFRLTTPGHLGEFVNCADEQAGQPVVDLLVHHHQREPFTVPDLGLPPGKRARAFLIAAVHEDARSPARPLFHHDVLRRIDARTAPGTVSELSWGGPPTRAAILAVAILGNRFGRHIDVVRRGLVPDPEAEAERL